MRCSDGVRLSPVAGDWRSHPLRDRESGEGPSSKSARAELGAAMAGESARASAGARRDVGTAAPDSGGAHGAYAVGPPAAAAARQLSAGRGGVAAGLIGAIAVTVISLVFIISYIGALHAPGPHSVPTGVVGGQAGTSAVSRTLDRAAPGRYDVASYPSATAARHAIIDRTIDVAAVFRPQGEQLLVATAISPSLANSTIKIFQRLAQTAGVPLTVQDVRPLPASDPDGLSKIYFMIALLAPSLTFGNMLITRISPRLHPLWHLAVIAVFAAIIAAVATALADPAIGALAGRPLGAVRHRRTIRLRRRRHERGRDSLGRRHRICRCIPAVHSRWHRLLRPHPRSEHDHPVVCRPRQGAPPRRLADRH